jgi:glycosyltransferase involved in cell wall biosynthesis
MSSRKYKILAFCPYYPPHIGGLEKYAEELHQHLANNGHKVTVITPDIPAQKEYPTYPGVQVRRFPALDIVYGFPFPKLWVKSFWTIFFEIYREDFDIIFSTTRFFITSPMALVFSKLKRTPWLHIEHGSDYVKADSALITLVARLVDETVGRLIFKFSTVNIAPSLSAKKFIGLFNKRKVPVIYRGFPWKEVNAISQDMNIREKYREKVIITFAGRLFSGKGVNDLIDAVSLLDKDKVELVIIGDGPVKKELEQQVKKLNIGSCVSFLGLKSFKETIAVIRASDIIINPSHNEGLPTSLLEAAACQIAIVATNVGGTAEIVSHNESALLIKPGDPKLIAKTLQQLINDPASRNKLAVNARDSVRLKFNWPKATTEYEQIIAESL